jgi:hypothetical protein
MILDKITRVKSLENLIGFNQLPLIPYQSKAKNHKTSHLLIVGLNSNLTLPAPQKTNSRSQLRELAFFKATPIYLTISSYQPATPP